MCFASVFTVLIGLTPSNAWSDGVKRLEMSFRTFDEAQTALVNSNEEIEGIQTKIKVLETANVVAPLGIAVAGAGSLFLVAFYPVPMTVALIVGPSVASRSGYVNPVSEEFDSSVESSNLPPGGQIFIKLKMFLNDSVGVAIETAGLIANVKDLIDRELSDARRELEDATRRRAENKKRFELEQRKLSVFLRGMDDADRIISFEEMVRRSFAHSPIGGVFPSSGGTGSGGFWTEDYSYTAPDGSLRESSTFHYTK